MTVFTGSAARSLRWALVAATFCALRAGADETVTPRDPSATTQPPRFIRYWAPFERGKDVFGAYTSVTIRDGRLEFWHAMLDDDPLQPDDPSRLVDTLAVRRGPSLDKLGPPEKVLAMQDLIDDVPRLDGQPGLAPKRAFSRAYVMHDEEAGYVGLVGVHPEYKGHYLHPALIVSPTGKPGTWRYLGQLKGDPAEEISKRRVWSDGGTILRLPDKRWRIYTNGYGAWNGLVALEADTLAGPWRLLRDADGAVRMMTPNIPSAGGQALGIFPNVLRVSETEWHAWLSDRWIPDAIWHFYSENGLDWTLYGHQPEIIRGEDEDDIKCMRSFVSPDGKQIVGMLSVSGKDDANGHTPWVTHWSRLPVGPPPPL